MAILWVCQIFRQDSYAQIISDILRILGCSAGNGWITSEPSVSKERLELRMLQHPLELLKINKSISCREKSMDIFRGGICT
jgi:hypothetical protein